MPTYIVFHGYNQSADIIRKKLKGVFPKDINLIIPNGPLNLEENNYGWFPVSKIDLKQGIVTIDDSDVNTVLSHNFGFREKITTVDGIIGFSQGCLVANVLLASGKIFTHKLMLFSPIPCPNQWKYIIPSGIKCKIYLGSQDELVSPKHSLTFLPALGFNNIEITEHRWGHVIPSTSYYKYEYMKFFNSSSSSDELDDSNF